MLSKYVWGRYQWLAACSLSGTGKRFKLWPRTTQLQSSVEWVALLVHQQQGRFACTHAETTRPGIWELPCHHHHFSQAPAPQLGYKRQLTGRSQLYWARAVGNFIDTFVAAFLQPPDPWLLHRHSFQPVGSWARAGGLKAASVLVPLLPIPPPTFPAAVQVQLEAAKPHLSSH